MQVFFVTREDGGKDGSDGHGWAPAVSNGSPIVGMCRYQASLVRMV